jgi:hypothetical protein
MSEEIEISIRDQENEALKLELSKITEREAVLGDKVKTLNLSIEKFNESVDQFSREKSKRKKTFRNFLKFLLISHLLIMIFGCYLGIAGFLTGAMAKSELMPGNNVQVNGDCRTRDGGRITFAGDQFKVISVTKDEAKGVVIGETPINVTCSIKDVRFESYSVASLFFKTVIKDVPSSSVRTIENDPIYLLNKKSILASGICYRDSQKKVIYSGRVLEVLNIIDIGKDQHKIIAVESSTRKQIECNASDLKASILDEELAKSLVQKELSSGLPLEATTLIGKDILITGTCVIENYKGKRPLMEFSKHLATVTSEDRENNAVTRITATVNDVQTGEDKTVLETATVICDKKTFSNVFIEEYKKPN